MVDNLPDRYAYIFKQLSCQFGGSCPATLNVPLHFVKVGLGCFVPGLLSVEVAIHRRDDLFSAELSVFARFYRLGAAAF